MRKYFSTVYYFGLGDCTNGGASSRHKSIIVIEESDIEEAMKSNMDLDKVFVLVRRELWGENHWYLRQLIEPKGKIGPMMGGNYAEVSEVSQHLLPIHDRYETQEEYDVLSR